MNSFALYGAAISSDIAFPLDLPAISSPRCEIRLQNTAPEHIKRAVTQTTPFYVAHGREVQLHTDRELTHPRPGQPWCYEVKGVLRFYWETGLSTVYYEFDNLGNPDLLAFWFVHLLLPLYFSLQGTYEFLHAGAVELNGEPTLFIAPSMGGKSTLTDHFIRQGHPLVSDDKVPARIESGCFLVGGSHPFHRPYRKFEVLGYRVKRFAPEFRPLRMIYLLDRCEPRDAVSIDEIRGFRKFDALMPNHLFTFNFLREAHLRSLSTLLNQAHVFRVAIPWTMERLPDVHDAICKQRTSAS